LPHRTLYNSVLKNYSFNDTTSSSGRTKGGCIWSLRYRQAPCFFMWSSNRFPLFIHRA